MSADIDFERRVRSELRSTLDRVEGPHPDWATSPAAAVVAADPARSTRTLPWRLLAVAAVLVLGSVAAVILASPEDQDDAGIPGCPTLADYAAASAQPSPVLGQAPEVSFPPVAPTASMTTGLLQPGDWAVIANDDGPGLQVRVRDIRECGRLPDLRSQYQGGSIIVATVDARVLRDDTGMHWLGIIDLLEPMVGDVSAGWPISRTGLFGVPGVDIRTQLRLSDGFAATGLLVMDVPATDKRITVGHPTINTETLPGLELADDAAIPLVRWLVRDGVPTGGVPPISVASPGATSTSGEVALGTDITVHAPEGSIVLRLSDVDTVRAYPGAIPAPGNVFVEVRLEVRNLFQAPDMAGSMRWRPIGPDGRELALLRDEDPSVPTTGIIQRLVPPDGTDVGWIVMEAPERGPVRLEYWLEDAAQPTFWVQVRD